MRKPFTVKRRTFLAGSASGLAISSLGMPRIAMAQPVPGGTLRVSVDQGPDVLNPLLHRVNPEYLMGELLYSGLTRLSRDMTAEPDLAESWSASDDLTTWTFTLRPGVVFHDGSPLTAEDVVATFTAILDEATGSPARRNVGPIETVTATDDLTVVFQLSGPYADLPIAVAYTDAKIVPAAVLADDIGRLNQEVIGTGPFRLVSYEPERLVVVERNPEYFLEGRPYLDRVEIVIYPDSTAESSAIIAGDTDLMVRTAPTDYERISGSGGVVGMRIPSGQFLNVIMRCDQPPFDDARVRRALSLAVDREALIAFVAEGYGTEGQDTPISPAYRYYTDVGDRQMNIDEARGLLAEAGHPDGLDLTLVASDRPGTRTQLGVAMREMAAPAGFNIEVQTMPHSTYLDQVWLQGQFYVGFYNMQPTPDGIFSLLYTSESPWNETRWNNAEFDRLVTEGRETADDARRAEIYAEAQQLMHDEVPTVIPVFFDQLAARRDYVENYEIHPRGAIFRLDEVWLGEGAPDRG